MYPQTLALILEDLAFAAELASALRAHGIATREFADGASFLAHRDACEFDFYVTDLASAELGAIALIKTLRLRTMAGLIVVSHEPWATVFEPLAEAGADMYLSRPVAIPHVVMAIRTVFRRSGHNLHTEGTWWLDDVAKELIVPDGTRVPLSEGDADVLRCLMQQRGQPVPRERLSQALGYTDEAGKDGKLNAAIFRLRRRIEGATGLPSPLEAKSRQGYVFKAPLHAT
jgi:two-component system OmpR family response regulator